MLTIVSFLVALGLLIAVHEYGHYRVAVLCGVKVLRFSIGFGKVLFRWQPKNSPTEFVIAAFPFGGYVKMLDEREAPVAESEKHLAFNTQPLRSRAAIVAAGPVANLLLAILLHATVNWIGVEQAKAVLAKPVQGSLAQRSGLKGGEYVTQAGFEGEGLRKVASFEDLRWLMTRGALESRDLHLIFQLNADGRDRQVQLRLSELNAKNADQQLFQEIGIMGPLTRPEIGEIMVGGAAQKAGLKQGDRVTKVGSQSVSEGQELRDWIRGTAGTAGTDRIEPVETLWTIEREGKSLSLMVKPDLKVEGNMRFGRIGAYVGAPPEMVIVRYGLFEGMQIGVIRTWDLSVLTLKMMGKMLVGESSLKNLSGPLTIADYAGKSASLGFNQYLVFLALISVSLGILNLLPLPVLDGGHLMYYLWEALTGKSVSDVWVERLQRGGVAILMMMMVIAVFNDVTRLLG